MMLDHLMEHEAAEKVRKAVADVLKKGEKLTPDLGGKSGTTELAEAIASRVR
jgi:isocitrate/isopropylmalate dehydrogenase